MANKVVICGVDTSKLPKVTQKEMTELILKVKNGGPHDREEFVFCNMRLVLSLVQRFCIKKEVMDDVFQVGVIGLLKAVDNFDLSVGVRFSTYAVPMIIGEIRRFLRDNNSLKVTRNMRDIAYAALQARERISRENGEASIDQIAAATGFAARDIAEALDAISEPISLYECVYQEESDGLRLMDQIRDLTASEDHWLESSILRSTIQNLDERERMILFLRYFEGKTQMEISEEIGISQAQVSRLEKNALAYMREMM